MTPQYDIQARIPIEYDPNHVDDGVVYVDIDAGKTIMRPLELTEGIAPFTRENLGRTFILTD